MINRTFILIVKLLVYYASSFTIRICLLCYRYIEVCRLLYFEALFMKRLAKIKTIYILSLAIILGFTLDGDAQKTGKREYVSIKFSNSKQEIVDLTSVVKKKCSESLVKKVGNNFIQVNFQSEFANQAESLIDALEAVVKETQKLLSPLELEDLKLYVLKVDKVPVNYKMSEVSYEKKFYLAFFAFSNKEDLNLDVCNPSGFCSEIFVTIPHELAHTALDDLITRKNTRWFDDGLAGYVGKTIYEKFSPNDFRKELEGYAPQVSLHRRDIRENIFNWKEIGFRLFKITPKDLSNEIFHYGASYQLIKEIIAESEKKGIDNPLQILLAKLKELREKSGKPANTDEIVSIIRNDLRVDPKTIGKLDAQTQKSLVDGAISLLSNNDLSTEKKSYALFILAGIDEIEISDKWINYLLDQVYQHKTSDENQRDIAATALVVRFNQDGFDKLLKNYLSSEPQLKRKSVKKAKAELAEFSLRPRPE